MTPRALLHEHRNLRALDTMNHQSHDTTSPLRQAGLTCLLALEKRRPWVQPGKKTPWRRLKVWAGGYTAMMAPEPQGDVLSTWCRSRRQNNVKVTEKHIRERRRKLGNQEVDISPAFLAFVLLLLPCSSPMPHLCHPPPRRLSAFLLRNSRSF